MDGADGGFFQMFERVFDVDSLVRRTGCIAGAVEFLTEAKLQLARGFIGEGDGDNVIDCGKAARRHADNAGDQLCGLARASGGFDQEAFRERSADALARRTVIELYFKCRRHGMPRSSTSGARGPACFRLTRVSS